MQRHWIFIGGLLAAFGVGLGAFGAHGLGGYLESLHSGDTELVAKRLGDWKTAALYQMHHALGMVAVGLVLQLRQNRWLNVAGWCFLMGILLFSGLLYALVLTEVRILGAIVPIGGISFIVGWISLALGGCCLSTSKQNLEIKA